MKRAGTILFVVLGIFLAVYGGIVRLTGSGTGFFLVWFLLAAIAFLLAAGCRFRIFQKLPEAVRIVFRIIVCLCLAVIAVTWSCILTDFHATANEDLDYIIVLGAQVKESGPSPVLKYRLDAACQYLRDNPKTLCIVSGGKGVNEPLAEGEIMERYLIQQGIDKERIIAETKSLNTVQNIVNSAKLFDKKKNTVGIVTNDFHVFRGLHIAEKQGYQKAYGIAAPSNRIYLLNNMLRETGGIVKDALSGNL